MRKIGITFFSLVLLFLPGLSAQAHAEGFPVKDLPREAKALADFVPKGWSVAEQVTGDLNNDGIADIAAILVQGSPDKTPLEDEDESSRAVIVLLGRPDGKHALAGTNDKLLQCRGCLGIKESVGISIKKGVVVLDQYGGSREYTVEVWRFRYDPQSQRFVLIGRDIENADGALGTGTTESFNYLTGQKITEKYRYDKKGERKIALSSKKEETPRKTPFMEDAESDY